MSHLREYSYGSYWNAIFVFIISCNGRRLIKSEQEVNTFAAKGQRQGGSAPTDILNLWSTLKKRKAVSEHLSRVAGENTLFLIFFQYLPITENKSSIFCVCFLFQSALFKVYDKNLLHLLYLYLLMITNECTTG